MGHYPIRCVRCLNEIPMNKRLLKLSSEEIVSEYESDEAEETGDIELAGGQDRLSSILNNNTFNVADDDEGLTNYKSVEEMLNDKEIVNIRRAQNIWISEDVRRKHPECDEDLIVEVDAKVKIKGRYHVGKMKNFYCPYCKEKLFPQAGRKPIYIISLMGPTSAGKTVYITMLHRLLAGVDYRLPKGYIHFEAIGKNRGDFQNYVNRLYTENKLPATTQEVRKDAYLLEAEYYLDMPNERVSNSCLLGLVDMRGEMFNGDNDDTLERNHLPQFKKSDAFLMMVDPLTLPRCYQLQNDKLDGSTPEELAQRITAMKSVMITSIRDELSEKRIPSVVALMKQDFLYKNYMQLQISLNQPVINPNFGARWGENWYERFYLPLHRSTQQCIKYLANNGLDTFLSNMFKNAIYMSVSSLGSGVKIHRDSIDNSQFIRPVRVQDPILYFLMALNVIPPFDQSRYYQNELESCKIWVERYVGRKPVIDNSNDFDNLESAEPKSRGIFGGKKK